MRVRWSFSCCASSCLFHPEITSNWQLLSPASAHIEAFPLRYFRTLKSFGWNQIRDIHSLSWPLGLRMVLGFVLDFCFECSCSRLRACVRCVQTLHDRSQSWRSCTKHIQVNGWMRGFVKCFEMPWRCSPFFFAVTNWMPSNIQRFWSKKMFFRAWESRQ